MKKLFKRFIAYTIDMLVVLLITQCISGIPQINKQLDNYNKYYNDYVTLYEEWTTFKTDLNNYFEDETLTKEEYNSLITEHENYINTLNNYYKDNKLTTDNYKKLTSKIDKEYEEQYKKLYYNIEKNSIVQFIIYLIVVALYYVGFNLITKGQTLGKKLTRLKIVNNKDSSKDVSVLSYIIRALILYQPIYYIIRLITINFLGINDYYSVTSIVYELQGYLEMLIIAMMMIRLDGRGPQDMLARTRVALYDRNGKEIKDKLNIMVTEKKEKLKNTSKKVVDEEFLEEENTSIEQTIKKEKTTKKNKSKKVIDEEPAE